jgi:hypothetical protein
MIKKKDKIKKAQKFRSTQKQNDKKNKLSFFFYQSMRNHKFYFQ